MATQLHKLANVTELFTYKKYRDIKQISSCLVLGENKDWLQKSQNLVEI